MKILHYEVYPDRSGGYRWRLRASNGKITADCGESYTTKKAARRACRVVRSTPTATEIIDVAE